ncbi:MAG: haloacid dehalogenase type II [Alphaproteobacteria bacterium]
MTTEIIPGIRACVFDAYGTLFDYASAAVSCRDVLGDKLERLNILWREKQLQYAWLRTIQKQHVDFWQVTQSALDFAMATLDIDDGALRNRLLTLYLNLDPFPEVPAMLKRLKKAGMKTAILSNGSPSMLDAVVKSAKLGELLDFVLSVEEVGVYKPHPIVYRLASDRLDMFAEEISFQSSNSWDAYAASVFGMRVVWCNRYGQRAEHLPGLPDAY